MSEYSISFITLLVIYLVAYMLSHHRKDKEFQKERESWQKERQQLLDRIQAGSFAEYKQAEVKIIRAQNEPKETIKLEVV